MNKMLHPQTQSQHYSMARGLAALGRGPDNNLIHLSDKEINGLQKLAVAHGGSLTRNPHTGLLEAGILSSIIPVLAGAAGAVVDYFQPELSPYINPYTTAAAVGVGEGVASHNWETGLMAGIGAYGGFGLASAAGGLGAAGAGGVAGTTGGAAATGTDLTTSALEPAAADVAATGADTAAGAIPEVTVTAPAATSSAAAPAGASAATAAPAVPIAPPAPQPDVTNQVATGQIPSPVANSAEQFKQAGLVQQPDGSWAKIVNGRPYELSQTQAQTIADTAARRTAEQGAMQSGDYSWGKAFDQLGSHPGQSLQDIYANAPKYSPMAAVMGPMGMSSLQQANIPAAKGSTSEFYNTKYRPGIYNGRNFTGAGYSPGTWSSQYAGPGYEAVAGPGQGINAGSYENPYNTIIGAKQGGLMRLAVGGPPAPSNFVASPAQGVGIAPSTGGNTAAQLQMYQQMANSATPLATQPPQSSSALHNYLLGLSQGTMPNQPAQPNQSTGPIQPSTPSIPPNAPVMSSGIPNAVPTQGLPLPKSTYVPPPAPVSPTALGNPSNPYDAYSALVAQSMAQAKTGAPDPTIPAVQYPVPQQSAPTQSPGTTPYMYAMASGGLSSLGGYSDGGRMLRGPGDGMSDSIPAVIHGARPQPAALADNEFVVPADVVSHLGNGSSDAGAKKLYSMLDRVRQARTGRTRQAPEVDADKFLPA